MKEGLFVIIIPDSKAAHANAPMMCSWRNALSAIGFERVRYEKLQHAHCMAFRKTGQITDRHLVLDLNQLAQMMYIPQDLSKEEEEENYSYFERPDDDDLAQAFSNLPAFCDDD